MRETNGAGAPCAVIYSGGKDGHLALLRALKDGRRVACLLHIDGGRRHSLYFNDLRRVNALRRQSRLSGIPLFVHKVGPGFDLKQLDRVLGSLFAAAKKKYVFDAVYSGSSNHDDGLTAVKLAGISGRLGIPILTPLADSRLADNISEMSRLGVKAVIVGVDRKVSPFWLGKPLDRGFLKHIELLAGRGTVIGGPDIQTLVTGSPVFSAPLALEGTGVFCENSNTFWGFRLARSVRPAYRSNFLSRGRPKASM